MYFYTTRRKVFDIVAEATLVALFLRMYVAYAPVLPTTLIGALAIVQIGVFVYHKSAYARASLYANALYDQLTLDLAGYVNSGYTVRRCVSPAGDTTLEIEYAIDTSHTPCYVVRFCNYLGDDREPSSISEWYVASRKKTGYISKHYYYFDASNREDLWRHGILGRVLLPRDMLFVCTFDIEAVQAALKNWEYIPS